MKPLMHSAGPPTAGRTAGESHDVGHLQRTSAAVNTLRVLIRPEAARAPLGSLLTPQ